MSATLFKNMLSYGFRGAWRVFNASTRSVLGVVTHVETQEPVAALTFDDGPHPTYTPRLLTLLQQHEARATFFLIGEFAQQHPELVQQIVRAGHAIGNHSWDHPSFPLLSRAQRRTQIQACERILAPHGARLFRPPYGQQSLASRLDVFGLGYEVVTWNVEVGDWWDRDARRMADLLARQLQPGSIILMHDALRGHARAEYRPLLSRQGCIERESMLDALTLFLDRARHFRFLTVPELYRHGRPHRQAWYNTLPAEGETRLI